MLENQAIHARREGWPIPQGIDPYCSLAEHDPGAPMLAEPVWWMLRVGAQRSGEIRLAG